MSKHTHNTKTTPTDEKVPTPVFTEMTPEPTPTPEVTQAPPAPTVEPTLAPVALNKQQATDVTLESVIEAINQSSNTSAKFAIAGLQRYIANMQPGVPMDQKDAAFHQTGLWKTLYNFIENTEEDFDKVYSVILGLFFKHKEGVFHEHYVFRAMSDVTLDSDEISAFQVLINLIKVTANQVGRQAALKQNVDISRTLANVFSENARQKILSFYGM